MTISFIRLSNGFSPAYARDIGPENRRAGQIR